jgi:multidrug efflux system membrane fusion protein
MLSGVSLAANEIVFIRSHLDLSDIMTTPTSKFRIAAMALALAAVGAGIWLVHAYTAPNDEHGGGRGQGGGRGAGGSKGVTQTVGMATAATGDLPVVLSGLGTVSATTTTTVRSRVDGPLIKLFFKEGDRVKEGQLLAQIDPSTFQVALDQARGTLLSNEAALSNAREDLVRLQTLLAQDSIAKQKVDAQAALVRQLEGTVAANKAAVDSAKLQLSFSHITAPISGRVGLRQVDQGNLVHASDPNGIVVITQDQPINVVFALPEAQLASALRPLNDGRKLSVTALDRQGANQLAVGQLMAIDNQIDTSTGTVKAKASFANTDLSLFPNQFVNVRLQVDTLKAATLLPIAAIQTGPQGNYVWVVGADNKADMRLVKVGQRDGERVALTDGIKAGERVVTDGVDRLAVGTPVVQAGSVAPADGKGDAAQKGGKRHGGEGKKRHGDAGKAE